MTVIPEFTEKGISLAICILTDISDYELKHREFKQRDCFHTALIKRLPIGVFMFDVIDNIPSISLWNPRMEKLFNIDEPEMLSKSYSCFLSEALTEIFDEALTSINQTGLYYSLEAQKVSTPRGERFFHIIINPISNGDTLSSYLCLMTDITESLEQKRELEHTKQELEVSLNTTSELLDQTGSEFSSIIDSSFKVSIFSLDRDLKYRFFNTRHAILMRERFGIKIKKGQTVPLTTANEIGMPIIDCLETAFKGKSFNRDLAFHFSDGSTFFADAAFSPLYDDDDITGVTVLLFDATEQRNAMTKAGIFQIVADHAEYGVLILNEENRIEYINPYWKEKLYCSDESPQGTLFDRAFPPDQVHLIQQSLKNLEQGGTHEKAQIEFSCPSGVAKTVHTIVNFVSYEDRDLKARGVALFCLDITAMEEARSHLIEARDDAERASIQKSTFVANMSHEFRTPLNAILGFSSLLKGHVSDPVSEGHLESIINSSNTLKKLINTVLDFSKIEAGKMEITPVPVDIQRFFNDLFQMFRFQFEEKKIDFEIVGRSPIPSRLMMDALRMQQIFINLINNALKFTHHGCVKVLLKYLEDKKTLLISIEDSGIGIAEEDHAKVFDTFEQREKSNKRQYEGTGLGLAITEKFIKLMKGSIRLRSDLGTGCCFAIRLPLEKTEDAESFRIHHHQPISSREDMQCFVHPSLFTEKMKRFGKAYRIDFRSMDTRREEPADGVFKIIPGIPDGTIHGEESRTTIYICEHREYLSLTEKENFQILTKAMPEIKILFVILSLLSRVERTVHKGQFLFSLLSKDELGVLKRAAELKIFTDIEEALPLLQKCEDESHAYSRKIETAMSQFDIEALEKLLDKLGELLSTE